MNRLRFRAITQFLASLTSVATNAPPATALIGEAPAFVTMLEHVSRAAKLSKPVLVIGERGTGKELIAARLHYLSPRWEQPLIKVNCAALTETLLETELFGHQAGAFTGATRTHIGRFEQANGGTLEFTSSEKFKLSCGGHILNQVVFESTGSKVINGNCTLPLGENPSLGSGGTLLKGTLSGSGELTQEDNFVIAGPEPGLDSFTDVLDTGYLKLNSAADVVAPAGTLTVNGDFLVASGATFDANGGTVNFEALVSTKRLSCGEIAFNLVTVSNVGRIVIGASCALPLGAAPTLGGGGEIVLNGDLTGSGALTVESATLSLRPSGSLAGFSGLTASGILAVSGTYDFGEYTAFEVASNFSVSPTSSFTAPAGIAKFGGNFNNVGPSFVANGGTVELTGVNQHVSGSTTFFNLTKVAEAEDTVTFKAGGIQTIAGALTMEGAGAEKPLKLVSSLPGETPWTIEAEGTRTVKWVAVSDSLNSGETIVATESIDEGGNTGWEFP